jgi:hypothetical protein
VCFSLTSTGKRFANPNQRFQFVIQGHGLRRKYEVGSSQELNIWYGQFAKAKETETNMEATGTESLSSSKDEDFKQQQEYNNSHPTQVPESHLSEQEYLFWRDYQRCIKVLERSAQMFSTA